MKKGNLVSLVNLKPFQVSNPRYGIVIESNWRGDWRMCRVLWAGEVVPLVHYRFELKLETNNGG